MPRSDSLAVRVLLTALVAFGPLSTDLYLPSLPTLVRVFESDIATVQLTLSVFLVGFAVSMLVYGPLADRFGRRPVLIGGVAIFLAASAACTLATTIEQLIAARFVQALGACCGPVVARAIVRDVFGRDRAATVLAYMTMAMALAPAVGPVLGGALIEVFGWRSNFVVLTLIAVAVLAAVLMLLAETNVHRDPEALRPARLLRNYLTLLGNRTYVGCVLTSAFSYSGIFAFISGSSFVLVNGLGLSPGEYGASFGAVVLGYMGGSYVAGRISGRLGTERMMRAGTLVSAAAGLTGFALAAAGIISVPAIIVPTALFLFGTGMTLPNSMAAAVGPYPTMAGLASALLGFVQMGVGAAVGILVGHLHDGTPVPMAAAIAVMALLAAATAFTFIRHRAAGGTGAAPGA
ncbi:multidrug effflux MFS transporter [Azospirillum halopraeferens]|uniref:multidrug effflux MFS transporter n=1 Tax=Azospirillum halopraeferens TaxID=34010 RepID=UPI00040A37DC|nr:multidrug effflux MFS transporter [Azospirillum halopraeferens]